MYNGYDRMEGFPFAGRQVRECLVAGLEWADEQKGSDPGNMVDGIIMFMNICHDVFSAASTNNSSPDG